MAPMASIDEVNNRLTLTTDGVATTLTRGATYSRALTRTVVRGPGRSGYPL